MRKGWSWREQSVDPEKEHFELRFGSADEGGWDDWLPVARVAPAVGRVFPVQFLVDWRDPANKVPIAAVRKELGFYLIELGEPDPWRYAIYHAGTAANAFSSVHWSLMGGQAADRSIERPKSRYPQKKQRELTQDERQRIRERIAAGDTTVHQLAEDFGCSASQIAGIKAAMRREDSVP